MSLTSTEIYKKCKDSIVGILSDINGKYYLGTGFFINKNTIATAAHNVFSVNYRENKIDKASNIILTITNYNNSGKIRIVKTNNYYIDGLADICIIKVPDVENQCIINWDYSKQAEVGETCYLIGNPAGIDFQSICRGIIRNPKHVYESNNIETILLDISGMQGNSGSPILNSEGNAIGIFTYGFSTEESRMGGGPGIEYCKPSLKWMINKEKDYVEKRNSGILLWDTVQSKDFINKQFNNFDLGGIRILHLADYSPFNKAGIQENDIIIKIDDILIGFYEGQSHINTKLWKIKKDKWVDVEYVRNNDFNNIQKVKVFLNISYKDYPLIDNHDYTNYLNKELNKKNRKQNINNKKNNKKINNRKN